MIVHHPFAQTYQSLDLPDHTQKVRMKEPVALTHCAELIRDSLVHPIDSLPLQEIASKKQIERKRLDGKDANAVIVVSDKTRPVPYKGEEVSYSPLSKHCFL